MSDVKVYMIANLQIHDAENYRNYEKGFFRFSKSTVENLLLMMTI